MGTAGADKVMASVLCAERDTVIGQQTAKPAQHSFDWGTVTGEGVSHRASVALVWMQYCSCTTRDSLTSFTETDKNINKTLK